MQKDEAKMSRSLPGGWLESGHGAVVVFVKDFRDPLERRKKLMLRPWASIKDIKDQLQVVFNVPSNAQKLFYQGRELKNAHNLQQCGIYQDNAVVDFVARRPQNLAMAYTRECDEECGSNASSGRNSGEGGALKITASSRVNGKTAQNLRPEQMPVVNIHPYGAELLPVALMKITHQALQGLALGLAPVLAMDGTGGTYFFKDPSRRNVGCFKPQDEEPFGPNNPRGLVGQLGQSGLRRGILSGEACERELAAYILDKDHFAGVPATSLVESRHPVFNYAGSAGALHFKVGSLQEFVRHDDVVSDLAPNQFSTHQVHKIVLLDMRLLNTDRNDANILVRKRRSPTTGHAEYELIPIDHGYCLPQFLEIGWCDWCWYNWPQLQKPLSAEDRAYVLSLSAQKDSDRLAKRIPLRRACRRNMIIASMVLQKGVRADLVLFEIARIMCREDLDAPSPLEQLCVEAFQQLHVVKLRKLNDALFHHAHLQSAITPVIKASEPIAAEEDQGTAPIAIPSSPRAAFRNLRVSIDPPSLRESSSFGRSPVASGAQSPPGFWASYAPFSSDDEEEDDRQECAKLSAFNSVGRHSGANGSDTPRLSLDWDEIASHALSDAVQYVENGYTGSIATPVSAPSNGHKVSIEHNGARSPTSSFIGAEDDKDEFESLNDALDEDVQDENLFLSILGRMLDEKIEAARRRQLEEQKRKQRAQCHSHTNIANRNAIPARD
ncbi:Phosphatidylinositol 4-kinase type 2-beta [Phytophthora pseudosyringae]|uniref:Phosphatidylinositol 4-kinase type 2-beta n=1 Tax=Phytophthora pseudosyringae TaxID=221518 RepID=A0A8T1VHC2_9STRA|nr:Phosphatidylinositol 4-kinase type 2-beta [Phytophthora pseudosyringae]